MPLSSPKPEALKFRAEVADAKPKEAELVEPARVIQAVVGRGGSSRLKVSGFDIGALIIRVGFWGLLYYNYNKEPTPK